MYLSTGKLFFMEILNQNLDDINLVYYSIII